VNTQVLHDQKIREIAEDYRARGYNVTIDPPPQQLPKFLKGLQPDIVASTPQDNVVIEVKTRYAIRGSDSVRRMADAVAGEKGWRFELVLLSDDEMGPNRFGEPLSLDTSRDYLASAKQILEGGNIVASFITAWIATEAVLRVIAKHNALKTQTLSPTVLLKELVFAGAISREQYQMLDQKQSLRNRIVHGFQQTDISRTEVEELITIASNLLIEARRAMPD
jgi:hypothetical protein